jgi:hypothetical protein
VTWNGTPIIAFVSINSFQIQVWYGGLWQFIIEFEAMINEK